MHFYLQKLKIRISFYSLLYYFYDANFLLLLMSSFKLKISINFMIIDYSHSVVDSLLIELDCCQLSPLNTCEAIVTLHYPC